MLTLYTKYGNFSNFDNLLTFMNEENLKSIDITDVEYCLDKIYGNGIYTKNMVEEIVRLNRGHENEER